MKILMIGTFDTKGGAAKVSWALKEQYEALGHKVAMFVHRKHSGDNNVHEIPQKRSEQVLASLCATDMHFWKTDYILDTSEFKEAGVVHFHNIHGNFLNHKTFEKIARTKPIVWTLHDMWALTGHNAWGYEPFIGRQSDIPPIEVTPPLHWDNRRFLFRVKKKMYTSPFAVVTCSRWLENEARAGILSKHRIETIHNGINASIFTPTDKKEARRQLSLPADKKIVLSVAQGGVNNPQKGGVYITNAKNSLQKDPSVMFISIGGKDSYIKNQRDLALYYSAADTFLFTSLAENFPLVIIEAMACGLPIVSFDVGGVKEAVTHGEHGYIARYKDESDVLTGLKKILSLSENERIAMGKRCRDRVLSEFDTMHAARKYIDLYNSLL